MISLNKTEPFTPKWREGSESPPVFIIRVGDVIERGMLEASLAGEYNARSVYTYELIQAFQDGVNHLLAGDPEQDTLIALSSAERDGEQVAPADKQLLLRAREVMMEHWPEYQRLVATGARRTQIAPIVAFRRFCVGWENVGVDFARGPDGMIPMSLLADLDATDLLEAGTHAYGLLYGRGETRNFPQPSKSDDAPTTSPSDEPSEEGGKSVAKSGRKTPGSRSRRGSGRS
ncbi:hypothetical protein ACFB49_42520 [Sphingomonas sp. DBB INV C78]|uniref:hypothetical protein n=1 Tax=Sphingomonas sp. DBB INV C78 TaxID=3349434 RepID=UPI0036D40452